MNENKVVLMKLKELRMVKFIKQREIALHIGISENAYSRIENGHTHLTIENLYRICEKLNVSVGEVLELSRKNIYNQNSNILMSQNEGTFHINLTSQEFMEMYKLMQEKTSKNLIRLIKTISFHYIFIGV
jgi:DNA-binding Xre family transcriptional regulator